MDNVSQRFSESNERLLEEINLSVNRDIRPMTDIDQYGISEVWVFNPVSGYGDCEDYALTKLYRLVRAGFPVGRCSIYVVQIMSGDLAKQYHAILVIDNVWVLDNLRDNIVRYDTLPYRTIRVIKPKSPR